LGALIGYGFIAEKGHLPVYLERARRGSDLAIVAIADVTPARREAARAAAPHVRIYTSAEELLHVESSRLDFVDIATPPYCHGAIAIDALRRGLHVLCEKPIALSFDEAKRMAECAERCQRVLFPCHNYRHAPVIKAVRDLLNDGAIGTVHLATLQTFRTTHARGTSEWRPDWRRELALSGGGIAMDHGSHSFYLAFEWLRAYPLSITATALTQDGGQTEDTFSCVLKFPTGLVTTHLTWAAGTRKVMYSLHGDRGAITVDDDRVAVFRRNQNGVLPTPTEAPKSVPSHWADASHREWFGSVLDRFAQAIERREFIGDDARDALECARLISAGYLSAQDSSREVKLWEPRVSSAANDTTPAAVGLRGR
jgi:predicted dehydrogenase